MTAGTGPGAARRRTVPGPIGTTSAITALAAAGMVTASTLPAGGHLLAWLALGLTAGYALSGSV